PSRATGHGGMKPEKRGGESHSLLLAEHQQTDSSAFSELHAAGKRSGCCGNHEVSLRPCGAACLCEWDRCPLPQRMAFMPTFPEYSLSKVLLLGAIAAASAFVVTILIVLLCVGCHR
ncbi:hypothetical protein Z043_101986, partial [Scleropages formosus]